MQNLGKILIITGIFIIIIGIIFVVFRKMLPEFFKLPGDIYINKDNFTFYFPVVTCIVISIIIFVIIFIISKISK